MRTNKSTNRTERLPLRLSHPLASYAIALAVCLGALMVRLWLDPVMPAGYPFVTFFPPVILLSFLFGRNVGIFAALLCGAFAWYFFIAPSGGRAFNKATVIAMAFYAGVAIVDIVIIHWMQVTNARLREAREQGQLLAEESARLAERSELLFQELQHRVGNNLQMVAAALSLQLRGLEEPRARRAISDAVARIQVIGSIQRQLYRSNGELVPLDVFIADVCEQIMRSSGQPGIACAVEAESGLVLPPDAAVPMALILAEALANALEHGLPGKDTGRIDVDLKRVDDTVTLCVRDNGAGLPEGFAVAQADTLGLRISRVLSRQLGADYALEDAFPGCTMRLSLPASRFTAAPILP